MDNTQDIDIKLLCLSDLHLGIVESDIAVPLEARMATFKRIVGLCYDHDIVLIAGDFIDRPDIPEEIMNEVIMEFDGLRKAGIEILYAPGRNETDVNGRVYPSVLGIPVTHLFSSPANPSPFELSIKGQRIFVYGTPPGAEEDITSLSKIPDEGFHLGLFYVEFNHVDEEEPAGASSLNRLKLRKLDLDFYVFGHNHNFTMFKLHERIIGAYPGSPEPVTSAEKGDRYILSVTVKNGQLQQIRRITVNTLQYQAGEMDCTGLAGSGPVREYLDGSASSKIIMDFTLTGERNFPLKENEIREMASRYYCLKIDDRSVPAIPLLAVEYMAEDTLRGEFFRELKDAIDSGRIPESMDRGDLARSLNRICRQGFTTLEDWLCDT